MKNEIHRTLSRILFALALGVLTSQGPLVFCQSGAGNITPAGTNNSPVQVVVKLTDSSCVIGTTTLTAFPLRSEALGTMTIPLDKIRSLIFSPDHQSVIVSLANGDKLQGSLGAIALKLQTIFGPITIPLERTTEIEVRCGEKHALQFDGKQNYVYVPSSADFYPSALTLEAWIQSPVSGGKYTAPVGNYHGASDDYFFQTNDGVPGYFWAFIDTTAGQYYVPGSTYINDGQWHHLALTWDGATLTSYLDGNTVGSVRTLGRLSTAGGGSFTIGQRGKEDWLFDGVVGEVRISNSIRYTVAFTPSCPLGAGSNTVAYWKFDEGIGTTAHDSSGNNHNGSLQGTPVPTWVRRVTCGK